MDLLEEEREDEGEDLKLERKRERKKWFSFSVAVKRLRLKFAFRAKGERVDWDRDEGGRRGKIVLDVREAKMVSDFAWELGRSIAPKSAEG